MAKQSKATDLANVETPKPKPHELQIKEEQGKTREQQFAGYGVEGVAGNAFVVKQFAQNWFGEMGITESVRALRDELAVVKAGDLANVETMLYGQAKALEAVFHSCLQRALVNVGEYPEAMERYMRLGLKAQSQCRTTLEALAEIKNPRAVAFVRQANITNGPQQVNNAASPVGRAEIIDNEPNELQRESGRSLAARASANGVGIDTRAAAVVEIDRAAHARGKGKIKP